MFIIKLEFNIFPGHVYIHENCALWSLGVSRPTDADFQTIGQVIKTSCSVFFDD